MKTILVIFALLFAHQSIAVAPYGIKGQNQTQTLYSNVHQFPEKSVVNIGGINALVYSSGIIYDGGFESATALDGWACTGNAFMTIESKPVDAATIIEGNKTLRIACNNVAGCFCSQDIPVNQQQIGRSVLLSGAVRTTSGTQGLTVIYRENGADTSITSAQVFNGIASTEAVVGSSATSIGIKFSVPYSASPVNVRLDSMKLEYGTAVTNQPAIGPRVAYTPTFTGFGTVTNVNCYGQQDGPNEIVDCTFTAGTPTATEARVSLRSGLTSLLSLPSVSIRGSGEISQLGAVGQSVGASYAALIEPNVSYITFSSRSSASTGLSKLNGSAILSAGQTMSIVAIIPISQYASSIPTYTGRCIDPRACENDFSVVFAQAGTVTTQTFPSNPWIASCTASSSGVQSCTYASGLNLTVPMSCKPSIVLNGAGSVTARITSSTTTGFTVEKYSTTALNDAGSISISCSKQGIDSENSKTLQQNVALKNYSQTIPPSDGTMTDDFMVSFGQANVGTTSVTNCTASPCAFDLIGTGTVTNITRAGTGLYDIVTSRTYKALKCTGTGISVGLGQRFITGALQCKNCNSMRVEVGYNGSSYDGAGTVHCKGYY